MRPSSRQAALRNSAQVRGNRRAPAPAPAQQRRRNAPGVRSNRIAYKSSYDRDDYEANRGLAMLDPTTSDSPPPHRRDILAWTVFITAVSNLINAIHGWW
jgi:hypothetical protein